MSKTWYRYELQLSAGSCAEDGNPGPAHFRVALITFKVVRETPKGVWLKPEDCWVMVEPRFVLKAARKRYACPSEEEAFESYKARKLKRIKILEQLADRERRAIALLSRTRESGLGFTTFYERA